MRTFYLVMRLAGILCGVMFAVALAVALGMQVEGAFSWSVSSLFCGVMLFATGSIGESILNLRDWRDQ